MANIQLSLPDNENVGRNFAAQFVRLDLILISLVVVHDGPYLLAAWGQVLQSRICRNARRDPINSTFSGSSYCSRLKRSNRSTPTSRP